MMTVKVCMVCEWRRVYALKRCRSCYCYRRRHGSDKPESYLIREGEKELERRVLEQHRRVRYALR
jgi:hypothetical protein